MTTPALGLLLLLGDVSLGTSTMLPLSEAVSAGRVSLSSFEPAEIADELLAVDFACSTEKVRAAPRPSTRGDSRLTSLQSSWVDNESLCALGEFVRKDLDTRENRLVVEIRFLKNIGVCPSLVVQGYVKGQLRVEVTECGIFGEERMCTHGRLGHQVWKLEGHIPHRVKVPVLLRWSKRASVSKLCPIYRIGVLTGLQLLSTAGVSH